MTILTLPDFCVSSFKWKLKRNEIMNRSSFGAQSIEASTPLWIVSMVGVPEYWSEAVQIEQLLEALAGSRNQLAVYHRAVSVPFGTMRGVWTLNSNAADGALSLSVTAGAGQAGKTVLKGDLIGLGTGITQQVIRVAADAVANGAGVIALTLNSALRGAFLAGAAVTWEKPRALFRQMQDNAGIQYVPLVGQQWSLDLIEDWRP